MWFGLTLTRETPVKYSLGMGWFYPSILIHGVHVHCQLPANHLGTLVMLIRETTVRYFNGFWGVQIF